MDSKFIKPSVFNADPNSKQASKEWRHWYYTFSNFVDSFPAEPARSNEDKFKMFNCSYQQRCIRLCE